MKKTQGKQNTQKKKKARRVLTEEQRLKRNAYMREYLREYYKDPERRKAKAEYQKARYHQLKAASKARAGKAAAKPVAKPVAPVAKQPPRKPLVPKSVAAKKTVKIGKGGGKKGK